MLILLDDLPNYFETSIAQLKEHELNIEQLEDQIARRSLQYEKEIAEREKRI